MLCPNRISNYYIFSSPFRKCVPAKFVQLVIIKKCMYLSLYQAKLEGNIVLKTQSNLEYLDLSDCDVDHTILEEILATCWNLKKLSLYKLAVTSKMIKSICDQNSQTLQTLVLSQSSELSLEHIQQIFDNCIGLTEINLDATYLSREEINCVAGYKMLSKVTEDSYIQ